MKALSNQKSLALAAAIAVLVGGLFWAVSRGSELGEMKIRVEKGRAEIQRGEELITVSGETPIQPGDVISTSATAEAILRLEGDRHVFLAADTRVEVLGPAGISSEDGSVLAKAQDAIKIMIDETEAKGQKAFFRIDRRDGATRAGVYSGAMSLSAPGESDLTVQRLRQIEISANQLYEVGPYELGDDPWDTKYLDPLFDLNEKIEDLATGFSNQLGQSLPRLDYFSAMVNNKNVSFMRPYVARQSPKKPEYTVNLMIGLSLANTAAGPLDGTFERGFGFYEEGATWGVVAGILGVGDEKDWGPVLVALTRTFSGSVAGGETGDITFAVTESGELLTTAGGVPGGIPGDDPTNPNNPNDPNNPNNPNNPNDPDPPDDRPTDGPSEEPPPECDAQCQLEDALDDPLNPSPDPSPSSLFDPPPFRD